MSIRAEIQSLSPSALIELFVLDMSTTASGGVLYFHAGTNEFNEPLVWQGVEYTPLPIQAKKFDVNTQGTLPRPEITVANINGMFSADIQANDDLLGCTITRKRTHAKFLDAVNFKNGNPNADPTAQYADDLWFIDQKTSENRYQVVFQLASVFDLMGIQLPYRQVIKNSCPWQYRGTECGYTGGYLDINDKSTTSADEDTCGKFLTSCKARRGQQGDGTLTFGGFPGANKYES